MAQYIIDNIPQPIDFQGKDMIQRTIQNAKNLLMCRMWEVPYDRFRGMDPSLYDLPLPLMNSELLPELDRVMIYEPDVSVVSAQASMTEEGETYIQVVIDVRTKEGSTGE